MVIWQEVDLLAEERGAGLVWASRGSLDCRVFGSRRGDRMRWSGSGSSGLAKLEPMVMKSEMHVEEVDKCWTQNWW